MSRPVMFLSWATNDRTAFYVDCEGLPGDENMQRRIGRLSGVRRIGSTTPTGYDHELVAVALESACQRNQEALQRLIKRMANIVGVPLDRIAYHNPADPPTPPFVTQAEWLSVA